MAYDDVGAMSGLFAPAYIHGDPISEAAVARWNAAHLRTPPAPDRRETSPVFNPNTGAPNATDAQRNAIAMQMVRNGGAGGESGSLGAGATDSFGAPTSDAAPSIGPSIGPAPGPAPGPSPGPSIGTPAPGPATDEAAPAAPSTAPASTSMSFSGFSPSPPGVVGVASGLSPNATVAQGFNALGQPTQGPADAIDEAQAMNSPLGNQLADALANQQNTQMDMNSLAANMAPAPVAAPAAPAPPGPTAQSLAAAATVAAQNALAAHQNSVFGDPTATSTLGQVQSALANQSMQGIQTPADPSMANPTSIADAISAAISQGPQGFATIGDIGSIAGFGPSSDDGSIGGTTGPSGIGGGVGFGGLGNGLAGGGTAGLAASPGPEGTPGATGLAGVSPAGENLGGVTAPGSPAGTVAGVTVGSLADAVNAAVAATAGTQE